MAAAVGGGAVVMPTVREGAREEMGREAPVAAEAIAWAVAPNEGEGPWLSATPPTPLPPPLLASLSDAGRLGTELERETAPPIEAVEATEVSPVARRGGTDMGWRGLAAEETKVGGATPAEGGRVNEKERLGVAEGESSVMGFVLLPPGARLDTVLIARGTVVVATVMLVSMATTAVKGDVEPIFCGEAEEEATAAAAP